MYICTWVLESLDFFDGASPLHSKSLPSNRTPLKSCSRCWNAVRTCDLHLCTCHCLMFIPVVLREWFHWPVSFGIFCLMSRGDISPSRDTCCSSKFLNHRLSSDQILTVLQQFFFCCCCCFFFHDHNSYVLSIEGEDVKKKKKQVGPFSESHYRSRLSWRHDTYNSLFDVAFI